MTDPKVTKQKSSKHKPQSGPTEKSLSISFKKKGWKNPNAQLRGQTRAWLQLKQILVLENYGSLPANIPTYSNIEASSSVYPAKKYCDITGFVAPYTDPKTKLRYASADMYQFIHKQLTRDDIEKYLALRNALIILK